MPSPIPRCPNNVKGFGCETSDVVVKEEQDECFVLFCKCCELVWVISKDGIRDKSKFENAAKIAAQQADLVRRWESRKKTFSVR
jgi:hypothetical protein